MQAMLRTRRIDIAELERAAQVAQGGAPMIRAREARIVPVVDDYQAAGRLYREVFGLEVLMDLAGQGGRA